MRLLGALGLVAPVALVSLWFGMPGAFDSWVREGTRSIVLAVAGGMLGVSLTAGIVFLYVRLRLRRLVCTSRVFRRPENAASRAEV